MLGWTDCMGSGNKGREWNCVYRKRDRNIIDNPTLSTVIVKYFIKASVLADSNVKYVACMDVYEPIIRLFEKGGNFVYRERGMSFIDSGLLPLAKWLKNFKNN